MQTQNTDNKIIGVVISKAPGLYTVRHDEKITICSLSGKLRKHFEFDNGLGEHRCNQNNIHNNTSDFITIGDWVTFMPTGDTEGTIMTMTPRRNFLSRRSAKPMPSAHDLEQVIAANIDQVIPVFAAADPPPKWHMLDRYLVSAEAHQIDAKIVITKVDLINDRHREKELMEVISRYRKIGYPVITTSAKDQQGVDELRLVLAGQTSVLVGKSGVGKTTLLNRLEPGLGLRVREVNSSTGKGRHTTTRLEMFPLAVGGAIIDTPGTREFGVWGVEPHNVAYCFPEMRPLLGLCKFGLSCQHDEEPGCGIREAVMKDEISPYRYKSYLRMKADL